MNAVLKYERRGSVAWLALNRPEKLNAINAAMICELNAALDRAAEDEEVRVVVLTGAGRAFSSGFDLDDDESQGTSATSWHMYLERDLNVTIRLWELPKPTIGAVHGWCLGGGCDLAMACDMIVAAEDSQFGLPEIRYCSGPVTLLLPFLIGQKKANELLFTGDTIDATEAHRIGLVNHVVPAGGVNDAVNRLAARIAPTPLPILRLTKLSIGRAYDAMGLRQAVHANLDLSAILNAADTPEQQEFDKIVAARGLKAALQWRDKQYADANPLTAEQSTTD